MTDPEIIAKLTNVIKTFCFHDIDCHIFDDTDEVCTCGLNEALRGTGISIE